MSSLHNQTGLGKRALVSLTAQQRKKGGLALSINYNYLYNCNLGSCNAHKTTVSRINVKQFPYVVKTFSMQTIRVSIY